MRDFIVSCVVCCVCVWCVCVSAHVCVNFLWCVMLLKSWCVMLACVWFDPVRGVHTFPCPLGQPTLTHALQVCTGWPCFPNWLVFLGFPLTHSTERWCGHCGVWCVVCGVCAHTRTICWCDLLPRMQQDAADQAKRDIGGFVDSVVSYTRTRTRTRTHTHTHTQHTHNTHTHTHTHTQHNRLYSNDIVFILVRPSFN